MSGRTLLKSIIKFINLFFLELRAPNQELKLSVVRKEHKSPLPRGSDKGSARIFTQTGPQSKYALRKMDQTHELPILPNIRPIKATRDRAIDYLGWHRIPPRCERATHPVGSPTNNNMEGNVMNSRARANAYGALLLLHNGRTWEFVSPVSITRP
jgi:hypothetical protein